MYLPKYIKQNSFKIYHFRIKVPKHLVKIIGKTEICRSLKTTCVVTAMRLALRLRGSFDNLFKSLGFEMPDMVKSALSLFEDRGKAATLSSADQKSIASGIAEATPTAAHPQLAAVAQEQIVRLEALPTVMPEVAPVDKFGFDPKLKQTSPPPTLEQLDQLEHVNTVGIAELKRTAEKLATSKPSVSM